MKTEPKPGYHYTNVLEHLKTYFPSLISDPIMDGYRVLIGHTIEMAEMLRERLERHDYIKVV